MEELHKSFAFLSQEEQKLANIFLNDVQSGDVSLQEGKTLSDYIAMYGANIKTIRFSHCMIILVVSKNWYWICYQPMFQRKILMNMADLML